MCVHFAPFLFSDGEEEVFLSSQASMQGEQEEQGTGEYPEEVDDEEVSPRKLAGMD